MKKVTRIFAIAALAFGMVMAVSCNKDPENEGGNGGNGGNGGGNTENLPTTIDENFDNGIPSTWTNIDADGDTYKWVASASNFQNPCGVDGSECAASASFINNIGALNTDNYLVSPKIYIEDGAKLTFDITSFQAEYADSYQVLVGKVENGAFVATATIATETASTGYYDQNGAWTSRSFDLSAYKGQSLCIAIRHNCSDCYWLLLDNFKVSK